MSPDCGKFVSGFNGECLGIEEFGIANCGVIAAYSVAAVTHDDFKFFRVCRDVELDFYCINIFPAVCA